MEKYRKEYGPGEFCTRSTGSCRIARASGPEDLKQTRGLQHFLAPSVATNNACAVYSRLNYIKLVILN